MHSILQQSKSWLACCFLVMHLMHLSCTMSSINIPIFDQTQAATAEAPPLTHASNTHNTEGNSSPPPPTNPTSLFLGNPVHASSFIDDKSANEHFFAARSDWRRAVGLPNTAHYSEVKDILRSLNKEQWLELIAKVHPLTPRPMVLANIFTEAEAYNRDFLFFVHIPKTAGKSFHQVLAQSFGSRYEGDYSTISPTCKAHRRCREHTMKNRVAVPRFDPNFAGAASRIAMPTHRDNFLKEYNPWDISLGHADTSIAFALMNRRRTVMMTVVRDPVERFFSFFDFIHGNINLTLGCADLLLPWNTDDKHMRGYSAKDASKPRILFAGETTYDGRVIEAAECRTRMVMARMRKMYRSTAPESGTFRERVELMLQRDYAKALDVGLLNPTSLTYDVDQHEFCEVMEKIQMNNYMTYTFAGVSKGSFIGTRAQRAQLSDQDLLAMAKAHLDSFAFIGVQERFQESVELFLYTFNPSVKATEEMQKELLKSRRNSSNRKLDHAPDLVDKVRRLEWMDYEIYEYAKKVFDERYEEMKRLKTQHAQGQTGGGDLGDGEKEGSVVGANDFV